MSISNFTLWTDCFYAKHAPNERSNLITELANHTLLKVAEKYPLAPLAKPLLFMDFDSHISAYNGFGEALEQFSTMLPDDVLNQENTVLFEATKLILRTIGISPPDSGLSVALQKINAVTLHAYGSALHKASGFREFSSARSI